MQKMSSKRIKLFSKSSKTTATLGGNSHCKQVICYSLHISGFSSFLKLSHFTEDHSPPCSALSPLSSLSTSSRDSYIGVVTHGENSLLPL